MHERLKGYTNVIWDWNGTLLDDLDLVVDAMKFQLSEHGLPSMCRDRYREVFRFPVQAYLEDIGFCFKSVCFDAMSARFMQEYSKRLYQAELFPGTRELLQELQDQGTRNYVLSASQKDHLATMIDHYGIRDHFEEIYGLSDHYARCKLDLAQQLMQQQKLDPSKTLLVGDTDHDLEVGKKLGFDVLLVADGHQSYARLEGLHHNVLKSRKRML